MDVGADFPGIAHSIKVLNAYPNHQTAGFRIIRNNWGGERVSYLDITGRLRTLLIEWTDIYGPDPVITVGAGRAFFRADLLRQLRRLIDKQVSASEGA